MNIIYEYENNTGYKIVIPELKYYITMIDISIADVCIINRDEYENIVKNYRYNYYNGKSYFKTIDDINNVLLIIKLINKRYKI